ncbi:MAG: efflux RND transporter periplasmic adaptor subunit [Methylococcales bacterium]
MNRVLLGLALLWLSLVLVACNRTDPQKPQIPPPAEVAVSEVHTQVAAVTRELVGRLAATRVAEVRARVAGIIVERVYKEGTDVGQGEILFRIDPAPLRAVLHAREAALAQARADAANAAAIAGRFRGLAKKRLISIQDLDSALASERSTAAAVKQAQANVEGARLDLGYATVTAPIAGRAGRSLVTEGALVGQGEATVLTRIEQIDSLYVNFSLSVTEVGELRGNATSQGPASVEVSLPDGKPYPQTGTLDFSDLAVDPSTGAVSLRAVLANPDRSLLPGMFVNLRLTSGVIDNAFVLPQAGLARDGSGAYVLVVVPDGKVVERRVEIQGMTHGGFILRGDLGDGDRVIVEGLQKVRPGDTVRTVAAGTPVVDAR